MYTSSFHSSSTTTTEGRRSRGRPLKTCACTTVIVKGLPRPEPKHTSREEGATASDTFTPPGILWVTEWISCSGRGATDRERLPLRSLSGLLSPLSSCLGRNPPEIKGGHTSQPWYFIYTFSSAQGRRSSPVFSCTNSSVISERGTNMNIVLNTRSIPVPGPCYALVTMATCATHCVNACMSHVVQIPGATKTCI